MATTSQNAPPAPDDRRSPTKLLLIAVGVLLVLLIPVMIFSGGSGERGYDVEVAEAQVRSITQRVTASGKVRPVVEVPISSEVSGEIVFLGIEEGDRVEEGQLLLRIRSDFYVAQREQAQAGLLQAQADEARSRAELIQAEADLERQGELHERGVVPDSDFEATRTRVEVAEASYQAASFRVSSAEAALRQSADQLRRTAIYAPMSGTVSMLDVELGQRVVGTAQMAGTDIMRIAELDDMEIEVDINENDVVNIALGDSARVEIDAYPERPLRGEVTRIANSARVTGAGTQDQVTSFPVKVRLTGAFGEIDDPNLTLQEGPETPLVAGLPLLRPGMSGTVEVFTATLDQAVVVPIQAVTVRDFNELRAEQEEDAPEVVQASAGPPREDLRRVVFVVRDGHAVMEEVRTGIADDTHIALLSGLDGSEEVVTGPFRILRTDLDDGDAVRPRSGARAGN